MDAARWPEAESGQFSRVWELESRDRAAEKLAAGS